MIARRDFGVASLSAVAVAASQGSGIAQEKAHEHGEHHEAFLACAKACSDCQRACDMCSTHCAHQIADGKKEHLATLTTCQDCADFCSVAAQIVSRGGPFAALICEACAEACARCAKECEKFPKDKHMAMCAEECRKCEKACRAMVKHTASAK